MAQHPYAATSGFSGGQVPQVPQVATIGGQPSYGAQIDPLSMLRSRNRTSRGPCLPKGVLACVACVVGLLALGGIAVAVVLPSLWNALTGADNSTTTYTSISSTVRPQTGPRTTTFAGQTAAPAAQCGVPAIAPLQPKIVGGVEAKPHSWPWLAALFIYSKTDLRNALGSCGGALVADQWVVTAAHCTSNMDGVRDQDIRIRVHLGAHDRFQGEVIMSVAAIFTNSRYSSATQRNDISLLKLSSKVSLSDWIQPLCLPKLGEFVSPGDNYYVAGWGATVEGGSANQVLMQTQLSVMMDSQCNVYGSSFHAASHVCAGWPRGVKAPCQGDSGGPLMGQRPDGSWQVVGVVSFAVGCGQAGYPDVFTDVAYFRDWIDVTIKN